MKIQDLPLHKRPREKLQQVGAENLSNKELLAILLRTGRAGKSALDIAHDILKTYPTNELLEVSSDDLKKIKGIDIAKITTLLAAFELTRRLAKLHQNGRPVIETTTEALAQLHDIRGLKKEHFVALYLNARNELIHKEQVSVGTVDASLVHPRDVFTPALECNASGVIVAHNHPSGDIEPSPADRELTSRLIEAGEILGIKLIKHFVVTKEAHTAVQ